MAEVGEIVPICGLGGLASSLCACVREGVRGGGLQTDGLKPPSAVPTYSELQGTANQVPPSLFNLDSTPAGCHDGLKDG